MHGKKFGEWLREKRHAYQAKHRIDCTEFAKRVGYSKRHILSMETGHRTPPAIEGLNTIAKVLELSTEDYELMLGLVAENKMYQERAKVKNAIEPLYGPISEEEFNLAVNMLENNDGVLVKMYQDRLLSTILKKLVIYIGRIRFDNSQKKEVKKTG